MERGRGPGACVMPMEPRHLAIVLPGEGPMAKKHPR